VGVGGWDVFVNGTFCRFPYTPQEFLGAHGLSAWDQVQKRLANATILVEETSPVTCNYSHSDIHESGVFSTELSPWPTGCGLLRRYQTTFMSMRGNHGVDRPPLHRLNPAGGSFGNCTWPGPTASKQCRFSSEVLIDNPLHPGLRGRLGTVWFTRLSASARRLPTIDRMGIRNIPSLRCLVG